MMDVPLVIFGAGRSGTTLLFDVLARHPSLAWPCQCWDATGNVASGRHHQCRPQPEPYDWWSCHYRGFPRPCRDLTAADVPPWIVPVVRERMQRQCESMGRQRLLTKWTGWPRTGFFDVIYPGAQYIQIIRDGRAVAASLMQMSWWRGWEGPWNWRYGFLTPDETAAWEQSGRSFFVLAGLQWARCMAAAEIAIAPIGDRCMTVRYEDVVRDPVAIFASVCDWAGLEPAPLVDASEVLDRTQDWRRLVSAEDCRRFESALGPELTRWGYA